MGFDHAWTYDHLVWGGLPDSRGSGTTPDPGRGCAWSPAGSGSARSSPRRTSGTPTSCTATCRRSTTSPVVGSCWASAPAVTWTPRSSASSRCSVRDRVDRFQEFVGLLVRLRSEDHVDADGRWFSTRNARTLPAAARRTPARRRQRPALAALRRPDRRRLGDHRAGRAESLEDWWAGWPRPATPWRRRWPRPAATRRASRATSTWTPRRSSRWKRGRFEEMSGRAEELGFTDVITHWPRPQSPYAGDVSVLEQVAAEVLPPRR